MISVFGIKTISLFDFWVIAHILSGIIIGYLILISKGNKLSNKRIIISILIIAYLWEITEYFAEIGLFGIPLMKWFYGVEFLPNRLLIDPLLILLGYFIVKRYPKTLIPSVIVYSIWILIHIFIFPDTTYLNRILI